MTDLMQIVEFGNQAGADPIRWDGHTSQYLVPATNRTRILDREHANGHTPGADGWLTFSRDLCGSFSVWDPIDDRLNNNITRRRNGKGIDTLPLCKLCAKAGGVS